MRPADPEMDDCIKQDMQEVRGMDVFCCETIESTRAVQGKQIVWYAALTFFARNRKTGEAFMVADIARGSSTLELEAEPVKVKLLMHPMRPGHGGPTFNPQAFQEALQMAAETSKHWSLRTAVKGFLNRRDAEGMDPDDYSDSQARATLLEDLERRWDMRPICTSVAIMVWQRYFKIVGSKNSDEAAKLILRWMPLFSDKTLPSALVKELSKCGWIVRGNLDA